MLVLRILFISKNHFILLLKIASHDYAINKQPKQKNKTKNQNVTKPHNGVEFKSI